MSAAMTGAELASRIEHANLAPHATSADIGRLCDEVRTYGFAAVCVHPVRVGAAAACLAGTRTEICSVVGFPSGAHETMVKAREAGRCVEMGAVAIDMVASGGLLLDGDARGYADDILAVRRAIGDNVVLKVIIEAPLLGSSGVVEASRLAAESGADYIKTSTGVYAQARLEDVRLLRRVLAPWIKIKAAGGIRTVASALELVAAGADRIGSSSSVAIVREMSAPA
jgi:deoxyribose-phosphate aldolase